MEAAGTRARAARRPRCAPRPPGKLDPGAHPRARGAHAPRRHRVPHPRRGAGRRAGALAAPRHDVVRRARRRAGDPARRGRRSRSSPASICCARACRRRAEEHRATPMIGRSHGIHAEPITAGPGVRRLLRRARARARARWSRRAPEIAVGKIAGAVGTYANLDPADRDARRWPRSGCGPRPCPRRSSRAIATPRCFAALARIGTAVERIALTVRHWQRTEVGEARRRSARARRARRRCRTRRTRSCRRTCAGSRACCARYAQRGAGGRGAVARARHLALVGRARDRPRRDRPRRLHGPRAPPAWSTGWSSTPSACAATWS